MCYDWRQDYNDYLNRIIEKKTEMYQLLSKKDLDIILYVPLPLSK